MKLKKPIGIFIVLLFSFSFSLMGAVKFKKTPYIVYKDCGTEVELLWQLSNLQKCKVFWGDNPEFKGGESETLPFDKRGYHSAALKSLLPDKKYYYKIVAADIEFKGEFRTFPQRKSETATFSVLGGTCKGCRKSRAIGEIILKRALDKFDLRTAVLHTGNSGKEGETKKSKFGTSEKWDISSIGSQIPFFSCRGGEAGANILMRRYGGFSSEGACYRSFDYGPVHFVILDTYSGISENSAQANWLSRDLDKSRKLWKVILYKDGGWSGDGKTRLNRDAAIIHRLAVKYGVDIIFNGNRNYYSRSIKDGVNYITTGGGGAPLDTADPDSPNLISYEEKYHYCEVSISSRSDKTVLSFQVLEDSGEKIDSFAISKSGNPDLDFSYTPLKPEVNNHISFKAETGNLKVNSYWWDFGDGRTSTLDEPVNSYSEEGRYSVSLTVKSEKGKGTCKKSIFVGDHLKADTPSDGGISKSVIEKNLIKTGNGTDKIYAWLPMPGANKVAVLDTETLTVIKELSINSQPYGAVVSPDGTRVYVSNYGSDKVESWDTGADIMKGTANSYYGPVGIAVSGDGDRVYTLSNKLVTGEWSRYLVAFDVSSPGDVWQIKHVRINKGGTLFNKYPNDIAISPDGTKLYVANGTKNNIVVVDAKKIEQWVISSNSQVTEANGLQLGLIEDIYNQRRMFLSPDGNFLYVQCQDLYKVIDTSNNSVIYDSSVTGYMSGFKFALSPDGTKIYIHKDSVEKISVLNSSDHSLITEYNGPEFKYCTDMRVHPALPLLIMKMYHSTVLRVYNMETSVFTDIALSKEPQFFGNFIGKVSPKISGRVTENGVAVEDLVIGITYGSKSFTATIRTDSDGHFVAAVPKGRYTITPVKSGYSFTPDKIEVDVDGDVENLDFLMTLPEPEITVTAEPDSILSGESSKISWTTFNSTELKLDGETVELNGTKEVSPTQDTIYTFVATGDGGSVTETVSVKVNLPEPVIQFSASPPMVNPGASSTLTWSVVNGEAATIDQGVGVVSLNGSVAVTPSEPTTYTITVTGNGYTRTATVTVGIIYPPPAVQFTAMPPSVMEGQSTKLSWSVSNATEVSLSHGIGVVATEGEQEVSPSEETTYTITAKGAGGELIKTLTVTISPLALAVTRPAPGSLVNSPYITVSGTIGNPINRETGVSVNGNPAIIEGSNFTAEHVQLTPGTNIIKVVSIDSEGESAVVETSVNYQSQGQFMLVTATPEAGIGVFTAHIKARGIDTIKELTYSVSTPAGGVCREVPSTDPMAFNFELSGKGRYLFTLIGKDIKNRNYSDKVSVMVYGNSELDLLLKSKWEGMKQAMRDKDLEKATSYFTYYTRDKFKTIFEALKDKLPEIADAFEPITLVEVRGKMARCNINRKMNIQGEEKNISFDLYFYLDMDGIWRIERF